jgi:hypothetical protein
MRSTKDSDPAVQLISAALGKQCCLLYRLPGAWQFSDRYFVILRCDSRQQPLIRVRRGLTAKEETIDVPRPYHYFQLTTITLIRPRYQNLVDVCELPTDRIR